MGTISVRCLSEYFLYSMKFRFSKSTKLTLHKEFSGKPILRKPLSGHFLTCLDKRRTEMVFAP